ncbi:MAG: hypothetical protein KKA81_07175, partial [Bacteroidetes bacterium]|nr:hypothetical protein [Bacteroidota bacterium]
GDYNFVNAVVAGGDENNINAYQYGEGNITNVYLETGSDLNNVNVDQDGLGNTVGDGFFSNGIYIAGDMNLSNVTQQGAFNSAKATIFGNGNTSGIIQH